MVAVDWDKEKLAAEDGSLAKVLGGWAVVNEKAQVEGMDQMVFCGAD